MANPNTIVLVGDLGEHYFEKLASVQVTPGHLLSVDNADKFKPHATAGGVAEVYVAIEDALQGKTIDDNYAIGDRVRACLLEGGDRFWGWIAAGLNATTDIFLASNGDGTFKAVGGGDTPLVRPQTAVDNSAGGVAVRCKLEVIR